MNLRNLAATVGCAGALLAPAVASAQDGATGIGYVAETRGPTGSVIVVRGSQTYALAQGDLLFLGDRIVTRRTGAVTFTVKGCQRSLEPTASIVVNLNVCSVTPISLTPPPPPAVASEPLATSSVVGPAIAASTLWAQLSAFSKSAGLLSPAAPAAATLGSASTID